MNALPIPLTDERIDAICAPGRAERWKGDGRQYDRDTVRLALAALDAQAPAPAFDPQSVRSLLDRFERQANRMGALSERCQGKGWPAAEGDEFTKIRDDRLPALRREILAAIALPAAPGAEPSTPAPVDERTSLRAAQADAVMPLIGPLLDAWENADHDALEDQTELVKQMEAINFAMEWAGDDEPEVQPAPVPAAVDQPKGTERPTGPIDVSFADSWTEAEKIGFIEHCLRWPACGYVNSPDRIESIRLAWKIAGDLGKRADQSPAPAPQAQAAQVPLTDEQMRAGYEAWSTPSFLADGVTYASHSRIAWRGFQAGAKWAFATNGMVLVPVSPTPEMKRAAQKAEMDHSNHKEWLLDEWPAIHRTWAAMLAAAPQTKEPTHDR